MNENTKAPLSDAEMAAKVASHMDAFKTMGDTGRGTIISNVQKIRSLEQQILAIMSETLSVMTLGGRAITECLKKDKPDVDDAIMTADMMELCSKMAAERSMKLAKELDALRKEAHAVMKDSQHTDDTQIPEEVAKQAGDAIRQAMGEKGGE